MAADASLYGLGTVLTQIQSDGTHRPVAYASQILTSTEEHYAQIEKESLAITWACECFSNHLIGKSFHIQTDHKSLVSLLSSKLLDSLPVRKQCFRMRLLRFTYTIFHIPGKELIVADALSRAPVSNPTSTDTQFNKAVDAYVNLLLESFPESNGKTVEVYSRGPDSMQPNAQVLQRGMVNLSGPLKPFIQFAGKLNIQKGLHSQIVIPTSLQLEMFGRLHNAHQGIQKCQERAKQSIWWTGLNCQSADLVNNCSICCKETHQPPELLMRSNFLHCHGRRWKLIYSTGRMLVTC